MGNSVSVELKNVRRRLEFDWLNKVAEAHMTLDETIDTVKKEKESHKVEETMIKYEENIVKKHKNDSYDNLFSSSIDEINKGREYEKEKEKESEQVIRKPLHTFLQADEVGYTYNTTVPKNAYMQLTLQNQAQKQCQGQVKSMTRIRWYRNRPKIKVAAKTNEPYDYSVHQPLK